MTSFKSLTIPQLLYARHESNKDLVAQLEKDAEGAFHPITFGQMWQSIQSIAGGFIALGVEPQDRIMHVSDNRSDWLHICLAAGAINAVDVPNGADSTKNELTYVLGHAEPKLCVLEHAKLYDMVAGKAPEGMVFVFTDNTKESIKKTKKHTLYNLDEVKKLSTLSDDAFAKRIAEGNPQDLSTLIYTSGTTGVPRGVMLTHRNFTFQLEILTTYGLITQVDTVLCVLPVWHSFERIANILGTHALASLAYSKPIAAILVADMAKVRPTIMASVPRIWEAIRLGVLRNVRSSSAIRRGLFHFFLSVGYATARLRNVQYDLIARIGKNAPNIITRFGALLGRILLAPFNGLGKILVFKKLKTRLGGRFRLGVSGAGALHPITFSFFQAIGITLCEGYGLTETAPVVAINTLEKNRGGTVGQVIPKVAYKVIAKDGTTCSPGEQGELAINSEQVMRGYFKDEKSTKKILSDDGWFKTGDLVVETDQKDIKILGRLKDTIVLSSGKNVEPAPIEDVLCSSQFIDSAFVVGQDKNRLAALLFVNKDAITEYAKEENIAHASPEKLCADAKVFAMLSKVVNSLVNTQSGFHPYELISRFHIITDELKPGDELSKTMKLKRFVIAKKYKDKIESLF